YGLEDRIAGLLAEDFAEQHAERADVAAQRSFLELAGDGFEFRETLRPVCRGPKGRHYGHYLAMESGARDQCLGWSMERRNLTAGIWNTGIGTSGIREVRLLESGSRNGAALLTMTEVLFISTVSRTRRSPRKLLCRGTSAPHAGGASKRMTTRTCRLRMEPP